MIESWSMGMAAHISAGSSPTGNAKMESNAPKYKTMCRQPAAMVGSNQLKPSSATMGTKIITMGAATNAGSKMGGTAPTTSKDTGQCA